MQKLYKGMIIQLKRFGYKIVGGCTSSFAGARRFQMLC